MTDVSAKEIAALRRVTGAGMLDCKRALEESDGDLDRAKTWLREKGLAAAAKRTGREATEGAVEVAVEGSRGAIVEITCETDFVAKGPEVADLLDLLARQVLDGSADDLAQQPYDADPSQTVHEAVQALAANVRENVGVGRVARFETTDGVLDGYKHVQSDRGVIGVLVEVHGVGPADGRAREVAHQLALHIASAAPGWVRRDDVPADVVESERQVLETLTRNEGKPEQAIPKIVEGRLNGFFSENVLLEQKFVREPKSSVGAYVEGALGPEATVSRFARVRVGED